MDSNDTQNKVRSVFVPNSFLDDKIDRHSGRSNSISPENSIDLKHQPSPLLQLPRVNIPIQSQTNMSLPLSSNLRFEDPITQKMKTGPSNSELQGITPGYTKYILDEHNAQYDYVQGRFSEDQIKEAFNVLDMNKDGGIASDDLLFFLDFIGEKATQEEVEEMIRMCDLDGSGEVKYEEFRKMAGGWSLTPLGQAFPPSRELVEKRGLLNQMMMEKEIQDVAKTGKITKDMVEEIKKSELTSPRFGQDEQQKSLFQSINNIAAQSGSKKVQRQVIGQNLKVIRSEEGQITSSNKQQSQLSWKDIMVQRKNNVQKYVMEKKVDLKFVVDLLEKVCKLDIIEKCSYDDYLLYLELTDGNSAKLLFNSLTESPVREEYAKNSDELIIEQTINFKFTILTILGMVNCRKHDKLEIAYLIQDSQSNGYINFDNLVSLLVYLYCIADIGIMEQKILKMTAKKGLKSRNDIIKKDIYFSMINEYGQVFEPI